jgi:hypothetical protein
MFGVGHRTFWWNRHFFVRQGPIGNGLSWPFHKNIAGYDLWGHGISYWVMRWVVMQWHICCIISGPKITCLSVLILAFNYHYLVMSIKDDGKTVGSILMHLVTTKLIMTGCPVPYMMWDCNWKNRYTFEWLDLGGKISIIPGLKLVLIICQKSCLIIWSRISSTACCQFKLNILSKPTMEGLLMKKQNNWGHKQ